VGPIRLGVLLGVLDVVVIAIGLAVVAGDDQVVVFVAMFGIVPGIAMGGLLGVIAKTIAGSPIIVRCMALCLPALALVWLLASVFLMEHYILVSSIPTLVAVLLLERGTRRVVSPPLPVARVHEES